jgi:hypothetical protein
LLDMYEYVDIPEDIKVTQNDLLDLNNIENLNVWFEKIEQKLEKTNKYISKLQTWILSQYETDIKKILTRNKERKEKELQTLKFISSIWFDNIPKTYTDKIINLLNKNDAFRWSIDLWAGKNLSSWIDLSEWIFWNASWENPKEIFTRFFNKMLSWNPEEPVNLDAIITGSGVWVSNKTEFMAYINSWIMKNPWSFLSIAMKNLENNDF